MWWSDFLGLSFWLNWVVAAVLIIAIALLLISYVKVSSYAPLRKHGESRKEHILHYYRNYAGLLVSGNGMLLLIILLIPISTGSGWVLVCVSVVAVLFTAIIARGYFMQAFEWRRQLKTGEMVDEL